MRRFSFGRLLLGTGIAAAVAAAISIGPAFTAPAGADGWHTGGISGYAVSGIHYELDGSSVTGVSFSLDKPASSVRVDLGGSSTECSVAGTDVSCALPSEVPVSALGSLSVSAA